MKILKTDSYISEKLSIRPVTKDMLAGVPKYKMFKTPYDMKQNFKTGDIAIFSSHMGNESAMSYNGKSVNEKLDIQPVTRERLGDIKDGMYVITGCVVEWDEDEDYINQRNKMRLCGSKKLSFRMKSDSLEELLINFAKKVAPTHKLDFVEDWNEIDVKDYTLVLYLKGILNKNTMEFRDATEKEFDDFFDGKRTLTNVCYYVDITKGGMRENLSSEMKQLRKKYNSI